MKDALKLLIKKLQKCPASTKRPPDEDALEDAGDDHEMFRS
jgi:hypothetical protein